jgi:HTH-type transcriptional regulator, transcriptional repressor of NAD biosynthesis genes
MSVKRGLTLGKYAPFHRGHQLVIQTALAEMDEVIVIIYDAPETTSVPLSVRANWIRTLYPSVKVIEAWDGPTEVGDSEAIKRKHEDYVLNSLKIRGITHFYSSEFYGEHMSQALGAVNRLVDCDRRIVPVSGSDVRRSPYQFREFVDPLVYRDLITTVVFVGAPSTGKTTIAAQLAEQFNTVWMPEYGREYWETHQVNRRLTLEQLEEIAEGHLKREDNLLLDANGYLFVDTNAITTFMFSLAYHGTATPRLTELAVRAASRYDLVFVCDVDIPYDDTWDRSGDTNRISFQKQIVSDLLVRKLPYFVISGDVQTRVKRVQSILGDFQKYMNLLDLCS